MSPIEIRLREMRAAQGLTQQALAELAQVRQATISAIESGTRRVDLDVLDRLATALKCEPGDLLKPIRKRGG